METKLRISAKEMTVAATVQLRRDESIEKLARRAGMKRHAFLYALKRLQEKGVLRPWVFVNPFQMGYSEIEILFSIGTTAHSKFDSFRNFLKTHPRVIWFGILGGSYQCGVRIIARTPQDCRKFLDELENKFGSVITRKAIVHILAFTALPKRYLLSKKGNPFPPSITLEPTQATSEPDDTDCKILTAMFANPQSSERELSRAAGFARNTIASRLAALRKSGILLGSVYLVSARALGYHAYRILVFGRGLQGELTERINRFVENDSSVVNMMHCLGEWDYELAIEVLDPAASAAKVSALYEYCGTAVDRIELVPVFEQGVSHRFLSEHHVLDLSRRCAA